MFDETYSEENFKEVLRSWKLEEDNALFIRRAKEINVTQDYIDWFNVAKNLIEDEDQEKHETRCIYSV